ncbi:MAG: hypothetical protein AAF214_06825 [Pseudomonadota bacterium]
MSDTTNPTTADLATQPRALPLRALHLIGVSGPPEARRALLRTAAGKILHVRVGDTLRRGTVVAIDEASIILDTGPTTEALTQVLTLPPLPTERAAA